MSIDLARMPFAAAASGIKELLDAAQIRARFPALSPPAYSVGVLERNGADGAVFRLELPLG